MQLVTLLILALVLWLILGVWMLLRLAGNPPASRAGQALARGCPLDPGEVGLPFETWPLDLDGGRAVPVWDIVGRGEGPTTVLVHDWSEAPLSMLARVQALVSERRRIIVPCLRGHCSGSGRCTLGRAEADDLSRLCVRLDEPVALEGSGLGAHIVESMASSPQVVSVTSRDAWAGPSDGLRRVLASRGFPSWPIAPLALLMITGGAK